MSDETETAAAGELDAALAYFRPHKLTGDNAPIVLTAGKMREHLAAIENALADRADASQGQRLAFRAEAVGKMCLAYCGDGVCDCDATALLGRSLRKETRT